MRLETERLILREWTKKDINDLVDGLSDLSVTKWLSRAPHPYTKKDAEQFIKNSMKNVKEKERTTYEFAIELKSEKKVIGGLGLERIDYFNGTAGGGIWINAKYHSQGYGSEAFDEKIRFAFNKLVLRRLENGYFKGNDSSRKMQEHFGYKTEGIRRKALRCRADGELKDEYITGLLKEEWLDSK